MTFERCAAAALAASAAGASAKPPSAPESLTTRTRAVSSMGVDARDIDNDGHEDLFIAANNNETFPLFRNSGKGFFLDNQCIGVRNHLK